MDQKCTNDIKFYYNKDSNENLAWLTQKTENPKSNKETQFSEGPTLPPPPLIRGWGVSTMDMHIRKDKWGWGCLT